MFFNGAGRHMKKISVTVMLPQEVVLRLNDLCDRCGVPRSFIIYQMVSNCLLDLQEEQNATNIVEVLKIINRGRAFI